MNRAKPHTTTVADLPGAMAAISKLPGIITGLLGKGKVDIVIKPHEARRSLDQNRLQRKWCKEASEQGDMTAEEYRGLVKLHFGVPIMRRDSEAFCEAYDRIIKPLPYEQKLGMMQTPLDFAVTRGMNKKQKVEYLDACYQHFTGLGFRLTDPSLRGMDDWREVA